MGAEPEQPRVVRGGPGWDSRSMPGSEAGGGDVHPHFSSIGKAACEWEEHAMGMDFIMYMPRPSLRPGKSAVFGDIVRVRGFCLFRPIEATFPRGLWEHRPDPVPKDPSGTLFLLACTSKTTYTDNVPKARTNRPAPTRGPP